VIRRLNIGSRRGRARADRERAHGRYRHALEATDWKRLLGNRTVVVSCCVLTQAFGRHILRDLLADLSRMRGSHDDAGILAGLPLMLSAAARSSWAGSPSIGRAPACLRPGRITIGGGALAAAAVHIASGPSHRQCSGRGSSRSARVIEFSARAAWGTCLDIGAAVRAR